MEKLLSFKESLPILSDDFKTISKKDTNISLIKKHNDIFDNAYFDIEIPKHILIEAKKLYPEIYNDSFPSHIRNLVLLQAKSEYEKLILDVNRFHRVEDDYGEKVIFINFKSTQTMDSDNWCGATKGNLSKINFQYFIGHRLITMENIILSDKPI